MSKHVQFEEFHLIVLAPSDLEDSACEAIRRVLESHSFRSDLRRAVRKVIRQYPDLAAVRVRISV
jgi:hypothetical protein